MNSEIFEKTMPKFLKDDIDAFVEGEKNGSTILDCLYCEVQGSINTAFWGNEITEEEANYLRRKYLGLVIE